VPNVIVTFLPATKDDIVRADIHEEFLSPPRVGEFLSYGKTQTWKIVQVVHCLSQYENTYCATVSQCELDHQAILKSEDAK